MRSQYLGVAGSNRPGNLLENAFKWARRHSPDDASAVAHAPSNTALEDRLDDELRELD